MEDLLNVDMISNPDGDFSADALTRAPRPSHWRTETSLEALLDPTPDRDSGQSQAARDQERAVWLTARHNRSENLKRKRGERDDGRE